MHIQKEVLVLGLDIGSVAISAVLCGQNGEIYTSRYLPHHGDVPGSLDRIQQGFAEEGFVPAVYAQRIAATGRGAERLESAVQFDSQLCCIRSVQRRYPQAQAILVVGGETFRLFRLNPDGSYRDSRSSTSCAAGTGSFLDQQAGRLQLDDSAELARIAAGNSDPIPKVATRCAVFAKTDLIHAQQEGYTLSGISQGLCSGLAKNIHDTLFTGITAPDPLVFTGGVAQNQAVAARLAELTGVDLVIDNHADIHGAIGASLLLLEALQTSPDAEPAPADTEPAPANTEPAPADTEPAPTDTQLLSRAWRSKSREEDENTYPPLGITRSRYPSDAPDFSCIETSLFPADPASRRPAVEVELFHELPGEIDVYIGIDIGSTSTKAVVTDISGTVYAGVYTRTSGRPTVAFQALFAALDDLADRHGSSMSVVGSAATGSGRKFIGSIINADEILDEISAHARAAVELNPKVDTIIEIGGQDAKFTTLHNGLVTLSIMNSVCAAGTGSFLEEQAQKLGVRVQEYAGRTLGKSAPHVSDRCTVFMERDVNHLLAEGTTTSEALTAAIHAVRENYLRKVAIPKHIGSVVMFQGATARNEALVAAFEQELKRPIFVSRYCHLTGALGAALVLRDKGTISTKFRGISLHQKELPTTSEVCELCTNHCKITLTEVDGNTVAFGFLCGRDYATKGYIQRNCSGFDLIKARRREEQKIRKSSADNTPDNAASQTAPYRIGLPIGLTMVEDAALWRDFFRLLDIPVVESANHRDAVTSGKETSEAEFCAPMSAYYGHVSRLLKKADYIFSPIYLQNNQTSARGQQQYCYFTQHASTVSLSREGQSPFIRPLVATVYDSGRILTELIDAFHKRDGHTISVAGITSAYKESLHLHSLRQQAYRRLYEDNRTGPDTADVVLIGRPYLILDTAMNKGIPETFGSLGTRVFYQDMLPGNPDIDSEYAAIMSEIPWYYAKQALYAAAVAERTPGLYPVFITAFKCGPDSFTGDFFRRIMERSGKPYLILEIDEHDSAVGYETRIEAAVRTFHNHLSRQESIAAGVAPETPQARDFSGFSGWANDLQQQARNWIQGIGILGPRHAPEPPNQSPRALSPQFLKNPRGCTLLMPNWDDLTLPLLAAVLRGQGIDARVMQQSDSLIRRSLHTNTGQCLPMNVIAENYIETVDQLGLDPARTALWVPRANYACNIPLFPLYIRNLIHERGRGFEQTPIYVGEITFKDISPLAPLHAYFAFLFAGILRRIGCRIRPYELEPGKTDKVIQHSLQRFTKMFEEPGMNRLDTVTAIIAEFEDIPYDRTARKPKIALFGDIYVRDNAVFNQQIIHSIEEQGGEVITTPYSEYAMMIAEGYFSRWFKEKQYGRLIAFKLLKAAMNYMEKAYHREFERILTEPSPDFHDDPSAILEEFDLRLDQAGETADNLLKTWYIRKHHPDIALFVQLNPGFCCAGTVTEALASRVEQVTGIPVLSLTYDGIGGRKNDAVIPYVRAAVERQQRAVMKS